MQSVFLEDELVPDIIDRLAFIRLQPQCIVVEGPVNSALLSALKTHYPQATCLHSLEGVEPGSVDVCVAHFQLPWREAVKQTLAEWRRVLRPEGVLMVTMLGPDTLQEIPLSMRQPLLLDMHDLGDALVQSGFQEPVLDVELLTLRYRDEEKCQEEMRHHRMVSDTAAFIPLPRDAEGCISLSIEVIYAHAFCPAFSSGNGEVGVPLSKIIRR